MKLNRLRRDFVKHEIVDEDLEHQMAAVAQREDITAIHWDRPPVKGTVYELPTAYGVLCVWKDIGWSVKRDDAPLVQARSPRSAVFTRVDAAKATALVHVRDGFGSIASYRDGLWWNIPQRPAEHFVLNTMPSAAADENLMLALEAVSRSWQQIALPIWTERADGLFELNTPYGKLVIRRLVGWTVERNGVPLVWCVSGKRLTFDKLEHAKTSALLHAPDYGDLRANDGTRWQKLARAPEIETQKRLNAPTG
jgi:hypothetical protein